MKQAIATLLNRKVRLWAYGVCIAVTGYLAFKGIVESEEVLYLNFVFLAVFGLAAANVPTKDAVDPPPTSPADKALSE